MNVENCPCPIMRKRGPSINCSCMEPVASSPCGRCFVSIKPPLYIFFFWIIVNWKYTGFANSEMPHVQYKSQKRNIPMLFLRQTKLFSCLRLFQDFLQHFHELKSKSKPFRISIVHSCWLVWNEVQLNGSAIQNRTKAINFHERSIYKYKY